MEAMGTRIAAVALLVVCLGAASALFGEAARTHQSFAATTYYDQNDTVTDIIPSKDQEKTDAKTDDPDHMRYPKGHYPGQTHVWNQATEKYESVNETDSEPNMRYPKGHYPGQTHVWNHATEKYETVNEDPDPPNMRYPKGHYPGQTHVWNHATENYETVNTTDSDPPNMRYPKGHYPGQTHVWNRVTEKYETVDGTNPNPTGNPSEGRYVTGYHGYSVNHGYKEGDTLEVVKSDGTYSEFGTTPDRYAAGYYNGHSSNPTLHPKYQSESQKLPDLDTFDPDQGRYRYGYHGSNLPTGETGSKTFMSMANHDSSTTTTDFGERYRYGYYGQNAPKPSGTTSTGKFKPVTYSSYAGNFETEPYPTSGVPFVPNGDGCRTAYWAENPSSWPAFLKTTETVGDVFGSKAMEVYGATTVLEVLTDYGTDAFKQLGKSGCTALLNSITRGKYPMSPFKVIEYFTAALVSKEAAAKQALVFETANVESISGGQACT